MNGKAIAKMSAAITIIVIIIVAGVGVGLYYSTLTTTPPTTTTAVSTSSAAAPSVLSIDDLFWPAGDLNQFNSLYGTPYSNWCMYTVYQSLVTLNGSLLIQTGDQQLLPMLATNWTVSPDGMTYTYNLRQNVTFSNGDPFNAYQVWGQMYGLYYLSGNSSAFLNGYGVLNFTTVNFGPATLALMASSGVVSPTADLLKIMMDNAWPIYVTSPYQIVFHLQAPFLWFSKVLVSYVGLLFDTQYVLQNGGFGTPTAFNTVFNQHPMPGTGPYVVADVEEGVYAKFTQNPTYWGSNLTAAEIQANPYLDPGHVKTVIINAQTDDVVRYTDLSKGTVQIAGILSQNWPLVLANPDKYTYVTLPNDSLALLGIQMNTQRYPTNITAFRQAIVHAINYTDVNQKVFFGELAPMIGPEYSGQKEFYDLGNLPPYSYNLTLAGQYLNQSHVNVATLTPIEFRVLAGCTFCVSAAQVVQAELGELGIIVNIEVTAPSQWTLPYVGQDSPYSAALGSAQQEAQLAWFGSATWAPSTATPADAWIYFVSYNSPSGNGAIYGNPVVQKCVDNFLSTVNETLITNSCTAAYKQVYDDAPYVWLGTPKLAFGGGSVVWDNSVVKSALIDPLFTGCSETAIFNTVTFVNG